MNSKFLNWNFKDLLKGFLVSVITAVLTVVLEVLNTEGLIFTEESVTKIISVSLIAGLSYLLKNFVTNSQGEFLKKDW
jgi:hypothetical protein